MQQKISGLNEEQVRKSREKHGSNKLEEENKNSLIKSYLKNLGDPIIRILIVAFVITVIFSGGKGGYFEAVGIAISIIISTFVSTISEYGSEKAFRKMQKEASGQVCTVLRNGKYSEISVDDIVVGDVVMLKSGDKVPADGILISGKLSCDMSALNGESREMHKLPAREGSVVGVPSDESSVFRGCTVTAGTGVMRVSCVGKFTFYGKIAGEIQTQSAESPLRIKLSGLAKTLSRFGYVCAVCVSAAYLINSVLLDSGFVYTARNVATEFLHALTLGISIVVVAVPEGLPMMITVVLSSNMIRMQKQNIRVRKPVGIETAGKIDLLFTDKTGTITYGKTGVACYITGDGSRACRSVDLSDFQKYLLGIGAAYAGECVIGLSEDGRHRSVTMGDSEERAILTEYLTYHDVPTGVNRLASIPFDSRIKMSAATVRMPEKNQFPELRNKKITIVKGAPELLLASCKGYLDRNGKFIESDLKKVKKLLEETASRGMRVLAMVVTGADEEKLSEASEKLMTGKMPEMNEVTKGAAFLCLIGFKDNVRSESPASVRNLKKAGVQTVMITGDSKGTAVAVAREVGIIEPDEKGVVLESGELRTMSDARVKEILPQLSVVCRALPDDKSRLVRLARESGRTVGMTGDGLNDAPALKAADVGFVMGSGTEVAKEAGDIIINSNDISSIEKAILYGRTIFKSIRKFIVFQLIINLSAVGISILGPFIGFENPVTVIQMLWINLIMDTLAAIAFAGEAPLKRYLKEPPVGKTEEVLSPDMITRIFVMGVYSVMLCLYYYNSKTALSLFGGRESGEFLSGFFALFVFSGIFGAFVARSCRVNIIAGLFENPVFITVMATVFTAQIIMIFSGGELFRCVPLTVGQLLYVIKLALTVIPAGIILEIFMKKRFVVKREESKRTAVCAGTVDP